MNPAARKVLVIGCDGSMGRRYMAILKHLKVDCDGRDKGEGFRCYDYTHAIIATPTDTHLEMMQDLDHWPISHYLCEKPVDKNPARIKGLIAKYTRPPLPPDRVYQVDMPKVNMVCNYKYCFPKTRVNTYDFKYSNYNTGKDGKDWDLIQLHYLGHSLTINTDLPYFELSYKEKNTPEAQTKSIELYDVEQSYITMIEHWLEIGYKKNDLWDLRDALKATEKIIELTKETEQ